MKRLIIAICLAATPARGFSKWVEIDKLTKQMRDYIEAQGDTVVDISMLQSSDTSVDGYVKVMHSGRELTLTCHAVASLEEDRAIWTCR